MSKRIDHIQRERGMNYYASKVGADRTRSLISYPRKNDSWWLSHVMPSRKETVLNLGSDYNHDLIFVNSRGDVMAHPPKRRGAGKRSSVAGKRRKGRRTKRTRKQ